MAKELPSKKAAKSAREMLSHLLEHNPILNEERTLQDVAEQTYQILEETIKRFADGGYGLPSELKMIKGVLENRTYPPKVLDEAHARNILGNDFLSTEDMKEHLGCNNSQRAGYFDPNRLPHGRHIVFSGGDKTSARDLYDKFPKYFTKNFNKQRLADYSLKGSSTLWKAIEPPGNNDGNANEMSIKTYVEKYPSLLSPGVGVERLLNKGEKKRGNFPKFVDLRTLNTEVVLPTIQDLILLHVFYLEARGESLFYNSWIPSSTKTKGVPYGIGSSYFCLVVNLQSEISIEALNFDETPEQKLSRNRKSQENMNMPEELRLAKKIFSKTDTTPKEMFKSGY